MQTIVVLGAHRAVAESVLECLDEREIDARVIGATTSAHVHGTLLLIDAALIEEGDLFVMALDDELSSGLAAGLAAKNKPVIDLVGVTKDAPVVFAVLDENAHAPLLEGGAVRVPVGLAEPIAGVIRALAAFGPTRATVATYESAAVRDRAGMDELSEQTRAVFTMKDVVAEQFAATLAFDTIPNPGGADDSPLDADAALEAEIAASVKIPVAVTRVLVPTFSADAAVVSIEVDGTPDLETVAGALGAARGLRYVEGAPPAVDAVDRDDALVGRLAIREGRITCWVASDRLRRGSATQVALLVERWLGASISDTSAESPPSSK